MIPIRKKKECLRPVVRVAVRQEYCRTDINPTVANSSRSCARYQRVHAGTLLTSLHPRPPTVLSRRTRLIKTANQVKRGSFACPVRPNDTGDFTGRRRRSYRDFSTAWTPPKLIETLRADSSRPTAPAFRKAITSQRGSAFFETHGLSTHWLMRPTRPVGARSKTSISNRPTKSRRYSRKKRKHFRQQHLQSVRPPADR